MSRAARRWRRFCLAVAAASALLLTACVGEDAVVEVTLAELRARPQAYDGQQVRVRGMVRSFDAPRHYWLEGAPRDRVGLQPAERVAAHVDRQVTVVGRYSYSERRGRQLVVEAIEGFDPPR